MRHEQCGCNFDVETKATVELLNKVLTLGRDSSAAATESIGEQDARQNIWEKNLETTGRSVVCDCWEFHVPYSASEPVVIDVCKILRESASARYWHDESQHQALRLLGERMTQLRSLFVTQPHLVHQKQQEQSLLLYLRLLQSVSTSFENNIAPFQYTLPNAQLVLSSDSFMLEYLVTLQTLLSQQYARASQDSLSFVERRTLYNNCVDLLQEMQRRLCQTSDRRGSWAQALIRYVKSPTNISSSSSQLPQQQQQQYTDLQQLLLLHWGGAQGLEARLHLCRAKSNEMCYNDFSGTREKATDAQAFHDAAVALMESVRREYEQAAEALGKRATQCNLFTHCRVMNYYWRCQIQYAMALYESAGFFVTQQQLLQQQGDPLFLPPMLSAEETERQSLERRLANRAFARTDELRQKHDSFVKNMRGTLALDVVLKQKYDRLIKLALELDVQLHKHLIEPDASERRNVLEQELLPYQFQQRTTNFLQQALEPVLQQDKALRRVCRFVEHINEIPIVTTVVTTTAATAAEEEQGDARLSNDFKRGMIEERRRWLRWFTSHYDTQKAVLRLEDLEPVGCGSQTVRCDDYTVGRLQERVAFLEWLLLAGGTHRNNQMHVNHSQTLGLAAEMATVERVHATLHVNNKFI
jgi:hypothetical protein